MSESVKIGHKIVGARKPCFLIAEIGINHNGDMDTCRKLIEESADAGFDAVKFQKRTVDVVYTPEELANPRENPFGDTNGDLKRGLEFGEEQYREIDAYCKELGIMWFVSCWDEGSVDFMDKFDTPCFKIASASLTDDNLLRHHRKRAKPIILSTGMSSVEQIDHAVEVLGKEDLIVLHCNSSYPTATDELNLKVIDTFKQRYGVPIGYSGHEVGLATTLAAQALGADVVERHVTLDRAMWGSDQSASLEPPGMRRLVRDIRTVEEAMGDGVKRIYDSEVPAQEKLRRVG